MSNLFKSGFVAFAQNDKLIINANESKIIKAIDEKAEEKHTLEQESVEEALAEALIRDAELEGVDFGEDLMLVDGTDDISKGEDARKMADDVIANAKEEAAAIVSRAHDEAQQLRSSAYEEAEQIKITAQQEGYRNGYEEAMQAAEKEIAEQQNALEQRKQALEVELCEKEECLIRETERQMVDLLCQLVPSITGVVIENQKDVLLYIINTAMQDLDNSKHFVIKVSSVDYEDLVERKDEIYGALNPSINLEIFEDAKLSAMQCLIETDNGIVDVSLDVQLENLITALKLMIKE